MLKCSNRKLVQELPSIVMLTKHVNIRNLSQFKFLILPGVALGLLTLPAWGVASYQHHIACSTSNAMKEPPLCECSHSWKNKQFLWYQVNLKMTTDNLKCACLLRIIFSSRLLWSHFRHLFIHVVFAEVVFQKQSYTCTW